MLDAKRNELSPNYCLPFERSAPESAASPELALLSRQTHALECIATQLELLTSRYARPIEVPAELQPEYELAKRRLLQEFV